MAAKKQLCRLFRYLVNESIEGREEELKGYTIAKHVFKKSGDFDPEQNPIVRIHAGRLRRMLRLYYLEGGKHDPVKIDIPKGRYIPFFSSHESSSPPRYQPSSGGDKVILNFPEKSNSTSVKPSLAILPFKNLTGNPDKDYLALGFAEELSVELTNFEDLFVIDPILVSESEKLLHPESNLNKGVGVRFLIDGSIQCSKDRLKILVKLIDSIKGEQIWADRFINEFTAQNISAVLEHIARQVSGILASEYGIILHKLMAESKQRNPPGTGTYDAILKYYHFEVVQSRESATEALHTLEKALKDEPDSGIAAAMLASMYGNSYMLDQDDAVQAYDQMGHLAERALKLDPYSITVRTIYAYKCFAYNEQELFFAEAEKCLAGCSSSAFRQISLATYISLFGEWEKGMALLEGVKKMDLRFPKYVYGTSCLYYFRERAYTLALEEAMQYQIPSLFWGPMLRAAVFGQLNRLEEARSNIGQLKQLKPDFENQAWYLITRYVKEQELAEQVLDGLRLAGMDIKSSHLLDYKQTNTSRAT